MSARRREPQKVLQRKVGLPISKLSIVSTSKGEYLTTAKQVIRGRGSADILQEVLPRVVAEIHLAAQHVLDRRQRAALH